jgi:hypothetical protein
VPHLYEERVTDYKLEYLMLYLFDIIYFFFSNNQPSCINRHYILVLPHIFHIFIILEPINWVQCLFNVTHNKLHVLFTEEKVPKTDFLVLHNYLFDYLLVL